MKRYVNLNKLRDKREKEGSPAFPFRNASAVAQNTFYTVDFEGDSLYKKFVPMTDIEVINQSPNTIEFFKNDKSYGYIPAYGIRSYGDEGIYRFKIMNVDSADIAANKLLVTAFKAPRSTRVVR